MSGERYFLLRNHMTGHVMQLRDADPHPGTAVTVGPPGGRRENQLFWQDFVTGTIRSKVKDMCLDVYGERVVVGEFVNGNPNQQWVVAGNRIQNRVTPGWVLGVSQNDGAVSAALYTGGAGQSWTIDLPPPRFFHIRHKQCGKYLVRQTSTEVALVDKHTCRHLADEGLWYEGHDGVLLTKVNDNALHASGSAIRLAPFRPGFSEQRWRTSGEHVINSAAANQTQALDLRKTTGEAVICSWEKSEVDSQKWTTEFVD